jgi:hypothetical protein
MIDRTRDRRLRRAAERRGYRYSSSARRDPLAVDYGTIKLFDMASGKLVFVARSLDEAERFLDTPRSELTIPDPASPGGYRRAG